MILILFTSSFPYIGTSENNFLQTEVQYLVKYFEHIVIIPENPGSAHMDLPQKVSVEGDYAAYLSSRGKIQLGLNALFSPLLLKELIFKPSILFQPLYLMRLLFFVARAELTRRWIVSWFQSQNFNDSDCLFYTYWFTHIAMGIGRAKYFLPNLKLVSRVHGYDLYEERITPPYWPCRSQALALTDFLFPDSDAGANYLRERYPAFATRIETERLGVVDPKVLAQPSNDGIYRIVSCSYLVAVKRIDLFMDGLAAAARRRPTQQFEWRHFGTGPLKLQLETASKELPQNIKVTFAGYSTQADLFNYYQHNPVDVFVNVSQSEGTPVAVMEAVSCGIPIIATAVGGNKEVVSSSNGILVSADPSAQDIADALLSHWDQPSERRSGSRAIWSQRYDACKNFKSFSQRLEQIRNQT